MAALLPDWLAHRAAERPAHTALVTSARSWSYRELDLEATTAAHRLAALGVRAGDRVATRLPNGAEPVILLHACLRLGAVLVPLNIRLTEAELAWQIERARAALVVTDLQWTGPLRSAATTAGSDSLRTEHDPDTPLAIIHTSGTTGRPRGSVLTVGNAWWSAVGSALNLGVHEDDRWLAVLPLFHVGGLAIALRTAIQGTTMVVHETFDAQSVNAAIDSDGITILSVVAVMLQRMLDARGDVPYPATLRCVLLGGGPAPRALLERCARLGVPVVQTYGLTETASQVATLSPADALARIGSSGRALYPNEIRVARPDGTTAAPGEAGEILVRGPVVTPGYDDDPAATARSIRDGWLYTGDVGHLDADGYLHVLDRRDDLIVTGGENVYPAEVEAALAAHPAVLESAVVARDDARWGQRVAAVVRLHDGAAATADELVAHCRALLAGYKVPRELVVTADPLPRTASGKLRRAELRAGTFASATPAAAPASSP